jgi:uncharacterized protein (DUF1684 family)
VDLTLADYRERVARMYLADTDLAGFRAQRDELFATHPQSAIPPSERGSFTGLHYFPPNDDARVTVPFTPDGTDPDGGHHLDIDTGGPDGVVRYRRLGILTTPWGPLSLWWLAAYGGGLFLPLRDGTSGKGGTYGGGRYLTDTVKGTFGRGLVLDAPDRITLDFNYSYNPSCAYDDQWACPLAPPENRVTEPIRAGEMTYQDHLGDS